MKGFRDMRIFAFALALLLFPCFAAAQSAQIEQALLAQAPPTIRDLSLALADDSGVADPIKVAFVSADLDGSRSFSYIVALYSTGSVPGGVMRVFKRQGAN